MLKSPLNDVRKNDSNGILALFDLYRRPLPSCGTCHYPRIVLCGRFGSVKASQGGGGGGGGASVIAKWGARKPLSGWIAQFSELAGGRRMMGERAQGGKKDDTARWGGRRGRVCLKCSVRARSKANTPYSLMKYPESTL